MPTRRSLALRSSLVAVVALSPLASAACKPARTGAADVASAPLAASKTVLLDRVTGARLFPEVSSARGLVATEDGTRRMLVDRMRLLVHADGSIERAAELLPIGSLSSVALPSRLGGGFLFLANQGRGTEMWRAGSWLDRLAPLTRMNDVVTEVLPGFDRLYARLTSGSRVVGIDPKDGKLMGLGPLPSAASYRQLAFADGWRAVVDTDLRGPLTTFDAGATWRSVGVNEHVLAVGVVDHNPAVMVAGGRYVVDPRGGVSFRSDAAAAGEHVADEDERRRADDTFNPGSAGVGDARRASPLGKRPLRAAAEDGWPDTSTSALLARGGALGRVSLTDGRVLAVAEDAYPDRRSTCHAVRLGATGVGFVCGEPDGPTTVYAFAPPLAMRPVLRFERARYVAASGNGALVIRGRCAEDAREEDAEGHWYCVRTPAGDMREVRVKGYNLGVERVVGLADGRIAVVVPPNGTAGAISIIAGGATKTVPLELPSDGRARDLKRGLWLDGFEEVRPGVLGGWVEAGGPFVGVEVALDGKVKAGELRDETGGGAVFGGRFAVALLEGGKALETIDGGMTWSAFDLPEREEEARAAPSRGCGPVGCALPGWVRVGWGASKDSDDMKEAVSPSLAYPPMRMPPTLHFDCSVTSVASQPPPEKKPASVPVPVGPRLRGVLAATTGPRIGAHDTAWAPFRNLPAPALAKDEFGVDNGPPVNDAIGLRTYAWGKAGADWTRNGRWLVRFDDRFDADARGGVHQSAATASPWAQQAEAVDAIGTNAYAGMVWRGLLDPGGQALLASACQNHQRCVLYAVADGQPILPIRPVSGAFYRPAEGGAVRVGETWYLLTNSPSYDAVVLWRAELGVAKQMATYPRAAGSNGAPRLVRRAIGPGVGILSEGPPEPGERRGSATLFVLPIDLETGALGEAVALTRRDFGGAALPRCGAAQDGWVFDFGPGPDVSTAIDFDNARSRCEPVELRVRVDPGRACVEKLAARCDAFHPLEEHAASGAQPATALTVLRSVPAHKGDARSEETSIPMAVTDAAGRRWGLRCKTK